MFYSCLRLNASDVIRLLINVIKIVQRVELISYRDGEILQGQGRALQLTLMILR